MPSSTSATEHAAICHACLFVFVMCTVAGQTRTISVQDSWRIFVERVDAPDAVRLSICPLCGMVVPRLTRVLF